MAIAQHAPSRWSNWSMEIKVWKLFAMLFVVSLLVMWFKVVHQDDEILALVRNEVVTDLAGHKTWAGSFVNTNSRTLRDVAVTVDLLDIQNRTVSKARAE